MTGTQSPGRPGGFSRTKETGSVCDGPREWRLDSVRGEDTRGTVSDI